MDESTTEARTLTDEDITTVSPGAASSETERPGDQDMQDADGTDTQDADGTDAQDTQDQDTTDSKDTDTKDTKDSDSSDAGS